GHGYQHAEAVELPGEFSRRGGILDVYPPDADAPYRVEFFGDEVESIRQFSPQTQRSLGDLAAAEVMGIESTASVGRAPPDSDNHQGVNPPRSPSLTGHFCDYLPTDTWTVLVEAEELHEQGKHYLDRVPDTTGLFSVDGVFRQLLRFPSVKVSALPSPSV